LKSYVLSILSVAALLSTNTLIPFVFGQSSNICISGICFPKEEDQAQNNGQLISIPTSNVSPPIRNNGETRNLSSAAPQCSITPLHILKASGNTTTGPSSYSIDGNRSTYWADRSKGSYLELEFESQKHLCKIQIDWPFSNQRVWNFKLAASNASGDYSQIYAGKSSMSLTEPESYNVKDILAKNVRVTIDGNSKSNYGAIAEINVYSKN
jgi:F5/8 type C domain